MEQQESVKNMHSNKMNDENDDDEKLLNELNATFENQRNDDPNHTPQPLEDVANDDDDDNIFLLASQRQKQLAEERRIQRRKRLREISISNVAEADVVTSSSTATTATSTATVEDNATTIDTLNKDLQHPLHHNFSEVNTDINAATTTTKTDDIVSSQKQNIQVQNMHPLVGALGTTKRSVEEKHANDGNNNNNNNDDDDDEFDMFSSSVSPPNHYTTTTIYHNEIEQNNQPQQHLNKNLNSNSKNQQQQQDWDDSEGYYKAVIGETIDLIIHPSNNVTSTTTTTTIQTSSSIIRVRVAGLIGKGVFSTVLKCTVISNNTSIVLPNIIAMKCIRHNDSMTKTAITTELSILQKLRNSPGIVSLLLPTSSSSSSSSSSSNSSSSTNNNSNSITPLEYRGHILFVFPCMEYNLRDVLQKFGKGIGISLPAVRSYFGQLLAALSHLHKFHIIHADIKPDNVLVSSDFAVIQIADFGSAMDLQSPDPSTNVTTQPTPYLVSRFYRAPEIILGLVPITHMIDLWSVAVTVAELFIGDVLFRGSSNNDMLYVFQQHLGPFTNRMIRQHLIQCQKFGTGSTQLSPHFQLLPGTGNSYHFTQRTTDTVTGVPVLKVLSLVVTDTTTTNNNNNNGHNVVKFPLGTPLSTKLLKAKTAKDTRKMVHQFIDLLTKCLLLDPSRRITLKDALRHEFFIVNTATTITTNNTMNATAGAVIK